MDYKTKAIEKAQKHFTDPLRISSVLESDNYLLITMINDELEEVNDGFEFPRYIVNKHTGDELLALGLVGIEEHPGFEDFSFDEF